jgi:uncharacterized membrane protein YesL
MRSWGRALVSRPGAAIRISLTFLLCALPVFSAGWAWGIAMQLALAETEERTLRCFAAVRDNFSRRGLTLLLLGLFDILVMLLLVLSVITLLRNENPIVTRAASAVFIWLDLAVLLSGIYRYPAAAIENRGFRDTLLKGLAFTLLRPGQSILLGMAVITVFLLSLISGLFFPLFAPGAVSLLCSFAYRQCVEKA